MYVYRSGYEVKPYSTRYLNLVLVLRDLQEAVVRSSQMPAYESGPALERKRMNHQEDISSWIACFVYRYTRTIPFATVKFSGFGKIVKLESSISENVSQSDTGPFCVGYSSDIPLKAISCKHIQF